MVEQYIRESTIDDQRESHSEHRLSSYDCRSIVHLRVRRCLRAVPYVRNYSYFIQKPDQQKIASYGPLLAVDIAA